MQRKKRQEAEGARAPQGLTPPAPDPRHPEAVLDTVPRAAGIDVHKMSLTCTVLVEDDSGHVASETRQYRMAIKNKARWLKMLRKANLQDVVGRQAVEKRPGAASGGRAGPLSGPRQSRFRPELRRSSSRARNKSASEGVGTRTEPADRRPHGPEHTTQPPDELSVGSNRVKCARSHGGFSEEVVGAEQQGTQVTPLGACLPSPFPGTDPHASACSPALDTPLSARSSQHLATHLGPDGGNRYGRYAMLMSLFAIRQAEGDASLVIEAAFAVAADGWWVFRNADNRPVATLPTAVVRAIDPLPPGDERGHAWTQAGNTIILARRPRAKASCPLGFRSE